MLSIRTTYVGLPIFAAITLVILAYFAWRRREAPGAIAFVYLCIALAIWSLGGALEVASDTLSQALFWARFKYLGVVTMPPTWLVFTLRYTGRSRWLTRRNLALLAIHPIVTLIVIWTNEYHGLYWKEYWMSTVGGFPVFTTVRGAVFYIHSAYSYALTMTGTVLLLVQARQSLRLYRMQFLILMVTSLVPLLGNVLTVAGLVVLPGLDITPITFTVAGAGALWALLGFRMLDIVPVARNLVLENMTDGLLVLDRNDRIIDLNPAAGQFMNTSRASLLGKTVLSVMADYKDVIERFRTTMNAQSEIDIQYSGQTRYYDLRISPLLNRSGELAGRVIVWRDITERKQNEEALGRNIARLHLLRRVDEDLSRMLDLNYVLAIALDFALRSSDADSGFIALLEQGLLRVAHISGPYPNITPGSYLPPDHGLYGRVLRNRQAELIQDIRTEPELLASTETIYAVMCVPLVSQDRLVGILSLEAGPVNHFTTEMLNFLKIVASRFASAIDNAHLYETSQTQLTELQTLYAKVSHLERLKTDMINIAAHDLRNPLSIITNYSLLLREDLDSLNSGATDQQKMFMDSIDQASDRILKITADILSLERIEQSAQTLQPINMCELAAEVFNAYQGQARNKSLQYSLNLPEGFTPIVNGDPAQVREAMSNLIGNAIKYTPMGGQVDVRLSQVMFRVLFEVQDTGFGIPANQQDNLFKPFFRVATEQTRNIEGSGLGLHLVKNIVERHHGRMIFHSVYGKGSTFGFELTLGKRATGT